LEPTLILSAMAVVTERIGLVGTASTTYNEPFNIARRFRALDLLSHGRAGWNAVTTSGPRISGNFVAEEPSSAERYARAEEFVAVVTALWDSWGDDVLITDIASGRYADTSRLRPIDHHGAHFDVRGPLSLPPSEQVRPVIYHAGVSDDVYTLTARTGEAMFSAARDMDSAHAVIGDIRERARRFGRPRGVVLFLPGLVTSIAETETAALARWDRLEELAGRNSGGSGHLRAVGTPEQVADLIEEWFRSGAVDGFTLMPDVTADGLPTFVDHVVPILQERGVFRREYEGRTLREHYGLPIPARNRR
jgi:FMN-dependent oxidoreductase (nitrilotriacetate monooxygenase family)